MNKQTQTFPEIFSLTTHDNDVIDCIEIPMIQRDYAQGRKSKEVGRIRRQFLSALYDSLTGAAEPIQLDFVYGNVADGKLVLLDGQQRLTTLFLLHWYFAKKENVSREHCLFLDKFTYRTRFSSTHFCESIMNSDPDFTVETLSAWITDQSWFMYSWEHDPTISSMLVMIDEIHTVFKDEVDLWDSMMRSDTPLISFYFLPLEDMGLTDSLYIRMNSRGKPLTHFEHFKAEFEGMIKEVSSGLYDEFIKKADGQWVDMLWTYRGDDNAIDDEFMKYFRFVTEVICYENNLKIAEDDFDLAYAVFSKENSNAAENLRFLFKAFDCWSDVGDIDAFFENHFVEDAYEENKVPLYSENINLFHECCIKYGQWSGRRRDFTLNNTILLYAILTYLMNKEHIDDNEFIERIRVMRNLVLNSPDEIRDDRMTTLLSDAKDVILKNQINLESMSFNEPQRKQEISKSGWRVEHNELVPRMNELEDHFLLRGAVGIVGLDELERLEDRVAAFYSVFNKKPDYITISRALLTMGDYSQLHSWRFLFGDDNDANWRELFVESKQRKHFDKTKDILLKLLDGVSSHNDTQEYLFECISSYLSNTMTPKDWRYYFVKYPKMRAGKNGRYNWHNDPERDKQNQYEVFMMNTSTSLNGRHWDAFLYEVATDESVSALCSLGEYGLPLIIKALNVKIKSSNESWLICDDEENILKEIQIPQESGVDLDDRVEILINAINSGITLDS